MRDLVTDLLESERLGQGHTALHLEATDLVSLVQEVADALMADRGGSSAVRMEADAGLPQMPVDRTRLRLLVRNLLDNALRHGADARQAPTITLRRDGPAVRLSVRDHGPGVDEAALTHLAEPFYRPDAARTRATGGVGLGLYLCKLVAQAHGGSFEARNALPGLEVRVVLPLAASRHSAGTT